MILKIGIIGAGACGIASAIRIKEKYGEKVEVHLFEQEEKVGKKILQTGNGKCNFSNFNLDSSYYNHCDFVKPLLEKYNTNSILDFFASLGILSKFDNEGRIYPYSESAASFLEVLLYHLENKGVYIHSNCKIFSLKTKGNKYLLNDEFTMDKIIVSIGGKARVKEYDDSFLKPLNLRFVADNPGLVSLKVEEKFIKLLSGLRMKVKVKVLHNGLMVYQNAGEVLFKDDSLSGIVIFSCSRYVNRNSLVELNLCPDKEKEELVNWFLDLKDKMPFMLVEKTLNGLFPKQLAKVLTRLSHLEDVKLKDISISQINQLVNLISHFSFHIVSFNDYNNAQIMCGGIDISEVNEKLQLKNHPSIFVGGEVLDIDGECGGFNLSFAWICAFVIANNIL